jgi:two-component system, cell cycle sensor histidine kinase and response regulator CckA
MSPARDQRLEPAFGNLSDELRAAQAQLAKEHAERLRLEASVRDAEDRYRAVVQDSPQGILIHQDGKLVYINAASAQIFGYEQDELIGGDLFEALIAPEERAVLLERAEAFYRGEKRAVHPGFRGIRKDGSSVWLMGNAQRILWQGRPAIIAFHSDVTEHRQTVQALRQSEARFRTLFEHAPEAIVVLDASTGKFSDVNDNACRMFGMSRHDLLDRGPIELSPPVQPDGALSAEKGKERIVQALAGKPTRFEWIHRDAAGNDIECEVFLVRLPSETRQLVRGSVVDISERKRAARREHAHREILEQIAKRQPLPAILESLVTIVEQESAGSLCSILLLDKSGQRLQHGAAPHLPDFYNQAVHGVAIGPMVGSCGAAAFTGQRVVAADIETHPNWAPYRELAKQAGVRSCWSEPIISSANQVLGTFAIYWAQPRSPTTAELESIAIAANLASIAIEHQLAEEARQLAEEQRHKLEAQIQHAQKLESLGVLAGGIAHDFNNLLTSIVGYSDLARLSVPAGAVAAGYIDEVLKGASRAADLTQQMLAYSGKGRFLVQPVDLSTLVEDIGRLLEVSISKKCTLRHSFMPNLPSCEADAAQMRQVIMNLIINASEAIGDQPGTITVSTGVMHCDRAYLAEDCLTPNLAEGAYVYLEVADTGSGMSEATRERIFDPFFTTKFTGRGLGLAAVLGIVRGHRGAIKVASELGKGTTFRVLFPASTQPAPPDLPHEQGPENWRGSGMVLIVDDEQSVRDLARKMLESMGFTVLLAANGQIGVEIFRREAKQVCLVLLDLTMPHLDGEEAFREIRRISSDVPIILSSGYNEQSVIHRFAGKGLAGFIQKPYRRAALEAVVRNVTLQGPKGVL